MRAAVSKALRKAVSRLPIATRLSLPLRGSWRKRSSRSFVSTNTQSSKARSGLGSEQIEDNVGGAVTRILAPFLSQQVVKRAVDELAKAMTRICAGNSPRLIKIRGPERVLALLRPRIVDLPIEVEYVEDDGAETVVEANSTRIVAELRPWAELLASFEA